MKWRGLSPANPKIQLVRPMLEQSKDSLREYAAAEKIIFREDESNEWLDIQRNLIRGDLLPLLRKKYQPALNRTILRVMEILRGESEVISEMADAWLVRGAKSSLGFKDFAQLPIAIQRRCIQSQLIGYGIPADFALVERLGTSPGKPFTIVPQVTVSCDTDGRLQFREAPVVASKSDEVSLKLGGKKGGIVFAGRTISWAIGGQKTFKLPRAKAEKEHFDADKVGTEIVLRHWRPGDRFQPIGMPKSVKLQDFFVNQKIPRAKRHDLVVAATASNEVFWVESLRISERFKLTPQTTRRLIWDWKVGRNTRLRVSPHHVRLAQLLKCLTKIKSITTTKIPGKTASFAFRRKPGLSGL